MLDNISQALTKFNENPLPLIAFFCPYFALEH